MTTAWGHPPFQSSFCGAGQGSISRRVSGHELVDTCDGKMTSPNLQRASEDTFHEISTGKSCQYTRCLRNHLSHLPAVIHTSTGLQNMLPAQITWLRDFRSRVKQTGLAAMASLGIFASGSWNLVPPVTGTFQEVSSCTRWPDPARTSPNAPHV